MAGEGTPIGALAVRIGADATDLIDGFKKAEKATDSLVGSLAGATGAVAAVAAGLFALANRAADAADQLGKLSQKVGVSVESLSELKYAGELADVSIDQLGTGLKQLSKFMVENKITGVTVEEQFLRIAEEFGRTNDGAAKTAASMKYFGKAGADLIPMLNAGRDGLAKMTEEARRFGLTVTDEAAKRAEEFNDNLTRLKGAADGLAMTLTGPFIEALGKASAAMLQAKKDSDSWLRSLSEGLFTLFTGDDVHKFNVRIFEATEAMTNAQAMLNNALQQQKDAGGPGMSIFDDAQVAKYQAQVKTLQAELERLLAMKERVFPDAQTAPQRSGDPTVPKSEGDKKGEDAEAERVAKQIQAGVDEEIRIQSEADAVMVEMRNKQLEEEERIRQARIQAMIDYYDQTTAIEEEALRKQHELEIAYMTDAQKFEKKTMGEKAKTIFGELSNITAGVAQHNRGLFELNKVAGIANAIIGAYEGISKTMAAYPYPWNIAMAAAHGVAAFAQVSAIKSTQFGSGGAPSIAGSTAAPPVSPVSSGAPGAAGGRGLDQTLTVRGISAGDLFSGAQVRDLAESLLEYQRNGGRVVLAS